MTTTWLGALLLAGPCALHAQDRVVATAIAPDVTPAAEGVNRFTLDLYKQVAKTGGDVFVSPVSVSTAMALAYRGAKGTTAAELQTALHYTARPSTYLATQSSILRAMNFTEDGRELHVANALWVQSGLPMDADYVADVATNAGGGLQRVDYRGDPDAARWTINTWVATNTGDRIKQLLLPREITENTRLALVNTVYWKGRWARPFSPNATKPALFKSLGGTASSIPLMTQRGQFSVAQHDGARAIELYYGQGEVSMVVLMPDDSRALPRFEARLTDAGLARWLADLDREAGRDTVLTLPRLHMESRSDLIPVLTDMGVRAAFSDADADFSGIASIPYPGEIPKATGLVIKHVIHQTFLDVDENGSEAAAATAVLMDIVVSGMRRGPPPPPPFIFRADKPFLFLLRDRRTKVILFIGRYTGPAPATPAAIAAPPHQ